MLIDELPRIARATPDRSLTIAQFATSARGGGAEKVARVLHTQFGLRGHKPELWVGLGPGKAAARVYPLDHASGASQHRRRWALLQRLQGAIGYVPGAGRLWRLLRPVLIPEVRQSRHSGAEDFDYPGVWDLVRRWRTARPDIIHGHNLHGGYFDLRALPELSQLAPVVLTLHDQWLLTGHCAYSLGCDRWQVGCGHCPDLSLYPAIQRDGTADNWRRKAGLYAASRLYITGPSRWLLEQVGRSPLAAGVVESRLIRIGIDRRVFCPRDRGEARRVLGLPADAAIVMFAANGTRSNPWKDYATLEQAVARLPALLNDRPVVLLAIGQVGSTEHRSGAELRMIPFISDPHVLATYYQAADLYLHATQADNSPAVVLEALACGTPVVASAVGGVPELVDVGQTGWLAPVGDAESLAAHAARTLLDKSLHARLADAAVTRIASDFDLDRQVRAYLDWFHELSDRPRIDD